MSPYVDMPVSTTPMHASANFQRVSSFQLWTITQSWSGVACVKPSMCIEVAAMQKPVLVVFGMGIAGQRQAHLSCARHRGSSAPRSHSAMNSSRARDQFMMKTSRTKSRHTETRSMYRSAGDDNDQEPHQKTEWTAARLPLPCHGFVPALCFPSAVAANKPRKGSADDVSRNPCSKTTLVKKPFFRNLTLPSPPAGGVAVPPLSNRQRSACEPHRNERTDWSRI